MTDIVDTTWDQIAEVLKVRVGHIDEAERSRHVKLMILRLGGRDLAAITEEVAKNGENGTRGAEWARRLRDYAGSHAPLGHEVDDSRESIYAEAVRDIG